MIEKGFEAEINVVETSNYIVSEEKPLKSGQNLGKKVDINVLKARAQEAQNRESRKNILTLLFFIATIGMIGIYLST